MPRERVENCSGSPWQPVVGWGQERGVQVATVAEGERSVYWLLLGADEEKRGRLGREFLVLSSADYEDEHAAVRALLNMLDTHGYATGLWADLDRRGCNDLIRLLRRARDAAYGRDE